jgi:exodeoxyribonuclease V alpha subunit
MAVHVSARLAWHMDGWNGMICKDPANNTYCCGSHSYPGTMISDGKNPETEAKYKGLCCFKIDITPPCIYSINAFGPKELVAYADPPKFFRDKTEQLKWSLPPATVCIWPYEEMYTEEMLNIQKEQGKYNNDARRENAVEYFSKIEPGKSLIFYYANYSNPFNEEEQKRYVVVGISRIKNIGEELFYRNCSQKTIERYGGGFVWQRNVTSLYPEEGIRLPYHLYLDCPEIIDKFLFIPDNARNFKYGTREISDDDALDLVERFLEIANILKEEKDKSENWPVRIQWLQSLIAELWNNRGLYPGMPKVLDYLRFSEGITYFKKQALKGKEELAKNQLFDFLNDHTSNIPGLTLAATEEKKIKRQWQLTDDDEQKLLIDMLPRFDLSVEQIEKILSEKRSQHGIYRNLNDIYDNPYIISEEFIGDNPDDIIPFQKIDHGVFPSPSLGDNHLYDQNDWRRLRALCVERLKKDGKNTFTSASQIIHDINQKLSYMPEWKRHQFTEKYFKADVQEHSEALTFREYENTKFIYLKHVYEDERIIENQIRSLANRPYITFKSPVTQNHWHGFLYNPNSALAKANPTEYNNAIQGQVKVCQSIFTKPVCVVSGTAGTGKTTVIKALIQAIEKAHGTGTSFKLLAPTGKAADQIREATQKSAETIHSFISYHGWLNENRTFKRKDGRREEGFTTYIIDEASMIDLDLLATLFKAINWASVQRLIFIGDPNQLPPIGRGKVFADIIDWLQKNQPECVGVLETNIRQMENRLNDKGTGILDLASLYIRSKNIENKDEVKRINAELMLKRVQEGGDIDKDLRIVYWNKPEELHELLINTMIHDMETDTNQKFNPDRPFDLWRAAFSVGDYQRRPEYSQVLSPYRSEQFGTDFLNLLIQEQSNHRMLNRGDLGGITYFDKVIQIVNKQKSHALRAYNTVTRKNEPVDVFNGEIGFTDPDLRDKKKNEQGIIPWTQGWFNIKRFQVIFSRKPEYHIFMNSKGIVEENIELAYAISVHKSQGSEFDRVYFIVPKHKKALLSPEMFYTGITRASKHCTLFIEEDISPLLTLMRPENSHLININSSLFDLNPIPDALVHRRDWYIEGRIQQTLADIMVRSKSEVIISNMLFERDIPFQYELPLFADDGTFYLPDFTITWAGEKWYWEHLGLLENDEYKNHWETKKAWYDQNFPGRLLITKESGNLSKDAEQILIRYFS